MRAGDLILGVIVEELLLSHPLTLPPTLTLSRPSYFSLDISSFALVVPASRPQTTKDSLKWHMAMASTFCP